MSILHRPLFIYDGDCAFCTMAASRLVHLIGPDRLEIEAYQTCERMHAYGLSEEDVRQAAWLILPDGQLHRGAAAVNAAMAIRRWGRPLWWIYRIPGIGWIEERVYALVSRSRHRH